MAGPVILTGVILGAFVLWRPSWDPSQAPVDGDDPLKIATNPTLLQPRLDVQKIEDQIYAMTNEKRAEHGLRPLTCDTELDAIARAHSDDMAERGYYTHDTPEGLTPTDRAQMAGYYCQKRSHVGLGENLMKMYTPFVIHEKTLSIEAIDAWMDSSGHRQNMLHPDYDRIGIGVGTKASVAYATQNFC